MSAALVERLQSERQWGPMHRDPDISASDQLKRQTPPQLAQSILDELAGAMSIAGRIKGSPVEYLIGIVKRAKAGVFEPRLGIPIAKKRSLANQERILKDEARMRRQSAPPPSEDTRRLLRECAAGLGLPTIDR